ncbi:MAG: RNA polymerase sigma factor [Bacteroidaceae bacterium]|nr:RNA polymerase sigma factor [Bacteroidaceae bacterium]
MTARQFTDTFMPLKEPLYRVAYYILESRQDAEDALQDLYVRLWNSRETLDVIVNPRAYCIMMMKNVCIDRIRRTKLSFASQELAGSVADDDDVLQSLMARERLERVMDSMNLLTDTEREVLRMHVMEDLSYDEISARTGISNLTQRVLLSRARKKIRNVK